MFKKLKSPLNAQIELTGACTHLCEHCYNYWRDMNGSCQSSDNLRKLSTDEAEIILTKLSAAEVFNVVVTGGEPLMNFETCNFVISSCRKKGMGVTLNSNLVLMTEGRAKLLKEAGLKHVLTSILGPSASTHDKLTQRPGSFDALLRGIKCSQDAGIQVSANMVVTQSNLDLLPLTAKFVASLGIKTFTATRAGCPGNCGDFSDVGLSKDQLSSYLDSVSWIRENNIVETDILEPIPFCGLHGVKNPEHFTTRKCFAGVSTITVSYNGSVRPCSHFDVTYGNLLSEDLDTIWGKMDDWRSGELIPKECHSCSLLSRCGGGCRMEAKTRGGGVNKLDPYANPHLSIEIKERLKPFWERATVTKHSSFHTANFKLRSEEFGGVVGLPGNKRVLLDKSGVNVLRQLKPNTDYNTKDLVINWYGLEPDSFISGLHDRKIAREIQL